MRSEGTKSFPSSALRTLPWPGREKEKVAGWRREEKGGGGFFSILDNLDGCIRRRRWLDLKDLAAWDWHGAGSTSAPGAQEKGSKKERKHVRISQASYL